MRRSRFAVTFVTTLILVSFASWAFAIDGVTLITQNSILASGGFPFSITQSGSYRLASNLHVDAGKDGIYILADAVTLDLNGFMIAGAGGSGLNAFNISIRAVSDNGNRHSVITIRNGMIANFGTFATGISFTSSQVTIEGMHLTGSPAVGSIMLFGPGGIVRGNSGDGTMNVSAPCVFTDNVVTGGAFFNIDAGCATENNSR
jgi:hypothetical protein